MLRLAIQFLSIVFASISVLTYQACAPGFKANVDLASNSGFSITPEEFQMSKTIYDKNCASCHRDLESSTLKDRTKAQIEAALKSVPSMASVAKLISQDDIAKLEIILKTGLVVSGPNSCNADLPEFVNVQRLNNIEYNNVIRDLTGLNLRPADAFPKDARGKVFSNTALALNVDLTLGQMYFESAIKTLDTAFAQARQNIVTCDPNAGSGHRACAEKIIKEFGLKAFRRPLTNTEVNRFLTRYDATRSIFPSGANANQFDESLKASLHAILIAPAFLYRVIDRTAEGSVRDLTPYELASRLSFFIWGSIPDATLFNLAANGSILQKSVLSQQVDRMLKDPKSAHMIDAFAIQWLGLDALEKSLPNKTVYPEFTESLRSAMLTESRLLLADIIQKDASPYLMLNSTYSYLNPELARHYGVAGPQSGFARVDMSSTIRRGVFGHGSLLTVNAIETESSIIKRGLYFLHTFLCVNPGAPPPIKPEDAPPASSLEGLSPRKRLEAHTQNPKCASCHSEIDPPGFALENFDGVGKYRTKYSNGDFVDSRGQFSTGEPMSNPTEMARLLENSSKFKACFARNIMTYALGRDLLESDKCAADKVGALVVAKDKKFSDIVKEIVFSPQFLKQKGSN